MKNIQVLPSMTGRRVTAVMTAVALMALPAAADNTTPSDARTLRVGQVVTGQLSSSVGPRPSLYYVVSLHPNRSYALTAWIPEHELSMVGAGTMVGINDFIVTGPGATTPPIHHSEIEDGVEFSFNHESAAVRPAAAGAHTIQVRGSNGDAVTVRTINLLVQETTLFSPWFSTAAGFEGFIELHNNTSSAVAVTLRAFGSAGTLIGNVLDFSIPANATVFKTAGGDMGVVAAPGGIVLTHSGPFGSISGNITTLSGAVGLSFDSPFTPRKEAVIGPN